MKEKNLRKRELKRRRGRIQRTDVRGAAVDFKGCRDTNPVPIGEFINGGENKERVP